MKMRKGNLALIFFLTFLIYLGSFCFSYEEITRKINPSVFTDVGRLDSSQIIKIEKRNTVEQLQDLIREADQKGQKISIAGSRHSQGGHIRTDGVIVLDMRSFNKIIKLDKEHKILTVQSGATWNEVQQYLNPHGLAVKVMQSSYVFTIGGTLSANAHGRDLSVTSIVETVKAFRLLLANGKIVNVSRNENRDLFKLAIGGYGMFGIILDVDLEVSENSTYERYSKTVDYKDFPSYFLEKVKKDPDAVLMLVRPSIHPDTFLKELVVTLWKKTNEKLDDSFQKLGEENNVLRDRFMFDLSRRFNFGKRLRWYFQKKVESGVGKSKKVLSTRNNAMRPPTTPLAFLDYYSSSKTDIIQEYYIPVRNFIPFMDGFRKTLLDSKMNVISSTLRYVKANEETDLAYAPKEDCFAIIQMSNVGLSKEEQLKAEETTQKLVDVAIENNGTYYLTYQPYPTVEQFVRAYPKAPWVAKKKKEYDPKELFVSKFYEKYIRPLQ